MQEHNAFHSLPPLQEDEVKIACCVGIADDCRMRMPHYLSDWACSRHRLFKVMSATLYAYCISLLPALVFGEQMRGWTDDNVGIPEILLATGGLGILYALLSGQGVVIVGVTGPSALFIKFCYELANSVGAPFMQYLAWVYYWSFLMHLVLALIGAANFVHWITNFTGEIYDFFIAVAFCYESMHALLEPLELFSADSDAAAREHIAAGMWTLALALITCAIALTLHSALEWTFFNPTIRDLLASYNMPIAVCVVTPLSWAIAGIRDAEPARLQVPDEQSFAPSADRSWIVNPYGDGIQAPHIAFALLPAVMLTILNYFDHNVSSLIAQSPKYGLQKPSAYNWDFLIIGVMVFCCGLLGLPFVSGLIPQAPMHVRALATIEMEEVNGIKRERYVHVEETRWSPLLQSTAVMMTLGGFPVLRLMPMGCIHGVLLYMGLSGFYGNELTDRVKLLLTQADLRPQFDYVVELPARVIHSFTLIQLACVAGIFVVAYFTPAGIIFPVLLGVLVLVRRWYLPCVFNYSELQLLDRDGEEAEMNQLTKLEAKTSYILPNSASYRAAHGHLLSPASTLKMLKQSSTLSRHASHQSTSRLEYAPSHRSNRDLHDVVSPCDDHGANASEPLMRSGSLPNPVTARL